MRVSEKARERDGKLRIGRLGLIFHLSKKDRDSGRSSGSENPDRDDTQHMFPPSTFLDHKNVSIWSRLVSCLPS